VNALPFQRNRARSTSGPLTSCSTIAAMARRQWLQASGGGLACAVAGCGFENGDTAIIAKAVGRGYRFLLANQHPDGS